MVAPVLVPGAAGGGGPEEQKARGGQRPALLTRFPGLLRNKAKEPTPVVSADHLSEYPTLADDLSLWLEQHEERFRRLDDRATLLQNQFWRQHLALIVGGLLATSLGAIQAAMGGGVLAVAVIQAVITGVLAGVTALVRSRRAQQGYLASRLKAERIKSEFFLFAGRAGNYSGPGREARLQHQLQDIEAAEG